MFITRKEYELRLDYLFQAGQRIGYGNALCDVAQESIGADLLTNGLHDILKPLTDRRKR